MKKQKIDLTDAVNFDLKKTEETSEEKQVPHFIDQLQVTRPRIRTIPIKNIIPSPTQPRTHFERSSLEELAASIKEKGLLQEIGIKQTKQSSSASAGDELYEIIYGERRWRACQVIGLTEISCRVFEPKEDSEEIALIENIQREDLRPEEQAIAIRNLIQRKNYTQEKGAERLGLKRAHVTKFVTVATFLDSPDASGALTSIRKKHAHITFETLYLAASRQTVEEGIALLKKASDNKLTVREARKENYQAAATTNKIVITTFKKMRRHLNSLMTDIPFEDHEKEILLTEVDQTLESFKKATAILQELRSRIVAQ
jgi:ParB family transcriptional regulator, chromosome partitioning protein